MSGFSRTVIVRLQADTTYVGSFAYVVSGFSRTVMVRLQADTTYVGGFAYVVSGFSRTVMVRLLRNSCRKHFAGVAVHEFESEG